MSTQCRAQQKVGAVAQLITKLPIRVVPDSSYTAIVRDLVTSSSCLLCHEIRHQSRNVKPSYPIGVAVCADP